MPVERLGLRPARQGDAARLLRWRNDPETRAGSFHSAVVQAEEHERWLRATLADPATELWIAEIAAEPIGQVRLGAQSPDVAVVSISIAPEARGRGHSLTMLNQALERTGLEVTHVRALIRPENERSLRLFTRAGFSPVEITSEQLVLERRLVRG